MMIRYCVFLLCGLSSLSLQAQTIPTPAEFLGYELGEQFSYHHKVVAYFEAVAAASPKVKIIPYGQTSEDRPLMVAVLTSEANQDKLDAIRMNNLIATGLAEGEKKGEQLPVVWLSYNIHGNEAVSSEASMRTLYQLAHNDTANWLNDMVVLMDPCVNPDGRDRYTNWYRQAMNQPASLMPESYEHHEPWPGGRFNHYLFDLNRDWAWQTQMESQQRAKLYHQWMPQVHVDFHEMGVNSPYFFGPAAKPYHEVITDWQREFQKLTGKNHASYFDNNGWLYFTKEIFDLFYPSYGDTWPTYQGAIGFTYEQGGSGRAGVGIRTNTGDTLRLSDRIAHHHTTGLSTIESAWKNRTKLLSEYNSFFKEAQTNPVGPYQSYVIKGSNDPARIQHLLKMLDGNAIRYSHPQANGRAQTGFDYQQKTNGSFSVEKNDILISAFQPQARLVKVLFEPVAKLEDSLTYDLTAWSLPYAYDLEAYASKNRIGASDQPVEFAFTANTLPTRKAYAYLSEWKDVQDVRFLSALLTEKIKVRYADKDFTENGKSYAKGTLIITRTDNGANFDQKLIQIANSHQQSLTASYSGFVDKGKDFGSGSVNFIDRPKVAIMGGDGVSPTSFGEMWHFFEQDLGYAVSVLRGSFLSQVQLDKFDVLILPSGNYSRYRDQILAFAEQGGKVIALDRSVRTFTGKKDDKAFTALGRAMDAKQKASAKARQEAAKKSSPEKLLKRFENREREQLSNFVAGSIYEVNLDDSHPLAYGHGKQTFLIKRNSTAYPYLPAGSWNVGSYRAAGPVSGFTGAKLRNKLKESLAIGVESKGKGQIIYFVDSPIFRQFWHSGKLLMGNAVFFN
ncbi:MAG: M14 family zinc carboxypeptidase [Bacteroidota bacterium]